MRDEICDIVIKNEFWIPAKNTLDAIARFTKEFEMNVLWILNPPFTQYCVWNKKSLMKLTMNVNDVFVLLKQHSKKDSGTILGTSNIKSIRSTLNFQSVFGLFIWYNSNS